MNFKDVLEYWKTILTLVVVVITATYSVITWAEDQKVLMRAEQQLIHNELYQEGRITRKRDTIRENLRIISAIQADDDEPSMDEQKLMDTLRLENIALETDIDQIKALLATKHE